MAPTNNFSTKPARPTDTKSGLTIPFLRKLGELGELSEAGGEKSLALKGGL
jgi:hypothetical protein